MSKNAGKKKPPKFTSQTVGINQGDVAFLREGKFFAFNPATGKFSKNLGKPDHRSSFFMTLGGCVGIFVKQRDANHSHRFGLAHVWKPKRMKLRKTITRKFHRSRFFSEAHANLLHVFGGMKLDQSTAVANQLGKKIDFPAAFADEAAQAVVNEMGKDVEILLFGGRDKTRRNLSKLFIGLGVSKENIHEDPAGFKNFIKIHPLGKDGRLRDFKDMITRFSTMKELFKHKSAFRRDVHRI